MHKFKEMVEERKEEQGRKMGWKCWLEGLGIKTCPKQGAPGPTLNLTPWLWPSCTLHRTRKQALSDAEILQQLEVDITQTGAQKEPTSRSANISNRKQKVIQKGEVVQHSLVGPPKAVGNILRSPPKEDGVRTTRGALGRRTKPSPKVVDQVSYREKKTIFWHCPTAGEPHCSCKY